MDSYRAAMSEVIRKAFEIPLRESGFRKKSGSWYLDRDEAILVANLQKSQFSRAYYVNLAVWLKRFGEKDSPKEHLCHIRVRLTSLVDDRLSKALDSEDESISEDERREVIESTVRTKAIPFLEGLSTLDGVKTMVQKGHLTKAFVHKDINALAGGSA